MILNPFFGATSQHKYKFLVHLLLILVFIHVLPTYSEESDDGHVTQEPKLNKDSNSTRPDCKSKLIFGIDYNILGSTISGFRKDDDFENWIIPFELASDLPFYMSGFDKENQPIWIFEIGRHKIEKHPIGRNKEKMDLFDKYSRFLGYVTLKSHKLRDTPEKPITHHLLIVDFEGYKTERVTNRKTVIHQLQILSQYRRFFENIISRMFVINVNFVAEVFINLARPFLGRIGDKVEIYGTQKSIWAPKLLKYVSKNQILECYGGSKGFKPFYVVGQQRCSDSSQ